MLQQVGVDEEGLRVARVPGSPLGVCGPRRADAVLQHGCAAEDVVAGLFAPLREEAAEEGKPARGRGIGDAEGEESVAAVCGCLG